MNDHQPMENRNTVVFGLDGACLDLIQPWIDDGSLPTLNDLINRGSKTELESCVPATTPPAWTSLTTGVNPGKHGIFGFYSRNRGTYDINPVTDSDVNARRLWDYTSEQNLTSLVVNVPVTHPGRETNGVIVPGYLAGNNPDTYPEAILDEIGLPDYSVYAPSEGNDATNNRLLQEWLELTESRRDLAVRLMENRDWDVLFLEFQKTDGAVHKFHDQAKVKRIFECVDECMADVLSAVPRDPNVFVVSDHGIGQEKDWSVALNTWLRDEGYLVTKRGAADSEGWIKEVAGPEADVNGDFGSELGDSGVIKRALGFLQRPGITVQKLEKALTRVGLYNLATRLAPDGISDAFSQEVINYEQSTAFYEGMGFSGVDVGVILNDERFYPDGNVSADEYETVRDGLIDAFENMTGPDGPPFERVQTRESVYKGPSTDYAPDIVLEQAERYVIGSQYPRGKTYIPADEGRIDHTRHGMLVAAGPDVTPDWSLSETPSIVDVTPTLVHLLDGELNERFDGRVLQTMLDVDREPVWRGYEPFQPVTATDLTDEEEADMRDRLRGIGYLE